MGYNLEGKAEFGNSGAWCQLTLLTGWVKGKLGGQSKRLDHCISLEPVTCTLHRPGLTVPGRSNPCSLNMLSGSVPSC